MKVDLDEHEVRILVTVINHYLPQYTRSFHRAHDTGKPDIAGRMAAKRLSLDSAKGKLLHELHRQLPARPTNDTER